MNGLNGCTQCKQDAVTLHYDNKDGAWYCGDCYQRPASRNELNVMVELKDGKSLTSAHYRDILSREARPDGSVIRKTNKRYI